MTQLNISNYLNLRPNERKVLEDLRQPVKNEVISVEESDKTGRIHILHLEDISTFSCGRKFIFSHMKMFGGEHCCKMGNFRTFFTGAWARC